ncbi:MAG: CAP domain-containing protein [Planctomycetes bacterium]|nr:CAP domain-containing protein [Planctomycetota bacterium]
MFARSFGVVAGLLLATSAAGAENLDALNLHPVEANMVKYTNAQRAKHGLAPLVVDARLLQSARGHAAWMTNAHTLRHTTAPVAENIAMGQTTSYEAVQDWMNSSGHRANMLGRGYTRIGAAAYTARNGRRFWCLQFLR